MSPEEQQLLIEAISQTIAASGKEGGTDAMWTLLQSTPFLGFLFYVFQSFKKKFDEADEREKARNDLAKEQRDVLLEVRDLLKQNPGSVN